MSTPPEKLAASIGHGCQNDHGVLADVAVVQLATAVTDVLCQPCLLMMMVAAASAVPGLMEALEPTPADQAATDAMAAAHAALAAD